MKFLTALLLSMVLAYSSFATIDPDPDQIGVYFDTNADVICTDIQPATPFWVYVIITRPTSPEIHGVEFTLCRVVTPGLEGMIFRLNYTWAQGGIDIHPVVHDWCDDGAMRGFHEPVVPAQDNALLLSIQYMLLAPMSLDFYLGPFPFPSLPNGLPVYMGADGQIIPLGISSGDPDLPVASVNGCEVIPVENVEFGSIKCLYR